MAVKQRNNTCKPVCTLYGRRGLNQARAYPTSHRHILLSLGSKQMQGCSWQIINLLLSSQDVLLFQCKSWFRRPRDKGSGLRMTRCQLPLLARGSCDSSALCVPSHCPLLLPSVTTYLHCFLSEVPLVPTFAYSPVSSFRTRRKHLHFSKGCLSRTPQSVCLSFFVPSLLPQLHPQGSSQPWRPSESPEGRRTDGQAPPVSESGGLREP